MTEQDHNARVQAWLDEAGEEDADKPRDLPRAIADAIGLDWRSAPSEDRDDLMILARAWTFKELAFAQ